MDQITNYSSPFIIRTLQMEANGDVTLSSLAEAPHTCYDTAKYALQRIARAITQNGHDNRLYMIVDRNKREVIPVFATSCLQLHAGEATVLVDLNKEED